MFVLRTYVNVLIEHVAGTSLAILAPAACSLRRHWLTAAKYRRFFFFLAKVTSVFFPLFPLLRPSAAPSRPPLDFISM